MTLTQLEYVVAVDRLRNFSAAARACHVSQPTLSMQLRKLEEEYGLVLFDRSKKPVLPVPDAAGFIEQARVVLREMGRLEHLGRHPSAEPTGDFRLGIIPTVAPYLLPLFLAPFARKYPGVKLSIEEMTTRVILSELESDRIDAGILATPLGVASLTETPLYYEPFWLYASRKHPLAGAESVGEGDLNAGDVWLLSEGHCLRNQIVRICSLRGKSGVFRNVRFESGSLETVIRLVDQGSGYTLLPQLAADRLKRGAKGVLRPFSPPSPGREVSLVFRRAHYRGASLSALRDEIRLHLPRDLPRMPSKAVEVVGV